MRQGQDNITSGFVFFTSQHRASVEVSLFSLATHFYQHLVQLQQQTIRCHNENKTKKNLHFDRILIFIPPLLTSCQKHSGVNSPEIEPILRSHDYSVTGCVITHIYIYISPVCSCAPACCCCCVSGTKKKKKLYHSALFQSLVLINTTQVWCYITGRSLDTKLNLPHHRNLLHLSAKTTTLFL